MKLWGGRFTADTDKTAESFHSSISFDKKLYREDIEGSLAHAKMLADCGIITKEDGEAIRGGLLAIRDAIEAGEVEFDVSAEDIHMNVETLLTERIGEAGKKLHTARSRNDQVALDLRMWVRRQISETQALLVSLISALVEKAEENVDTLMPGFTHLQKAQPISFAHHLLAYQQMFCRDHSRLADCAARLNISPLGSGALAGTGFPIDRNETAAELGFDAPSANTLDGVSDRDYAIEYMADASIIMMHLSRFCEEMILWNSQEFGYITMDDAYSTGSSIMPQKKNPDMAELIRGKTGRVYGDLVALLTTMKGLPLAYNKDMQEDKEAVFDAVDTVKGCLQVFTPMLRTMRVNAENMAADVKGGFLNATDLADYLAAKGLPFRSAHAVSGHLVHYAEEKGCALSDLSLEELRRESPLFEEDIYEAIDPHHCLAARKTYGGPAPEAVSRAIKEAKEWLRDIDK
ncbi:MAG: argininosuccinate lyase [Firmicutes bacterium]|nr:argininosuccinate lyase [Bacillota bacterium]